jgi:L-asparaginase II
MTSAAPMAEIFRGSILESVHVGHAVISRPDGQIVEAWGDPEQVILPRSSCKMLQALPLLESGAGKDLTGEQLALACASHEGERQHVDLVRRWLDDLGLDEHALCCGPQPSRIDDLRNEMIRTGEPVTRLFNNCSGKHTGFLTLTRHLGAGPDYVALDHPVQVAVRAAFEDMTDQASPGHGIDGCSAPNFATTLSGLAGAMARFAVAGQKGDLRDRSAAKLRDAMMAHPHMVAGTGDVSTDIMKAAPGRVVAKSGAEGVYVAILPEAGLGIALKIADGAGRASETAIAALLVRLGVLDAGAPIAAQLLRRPVTNWAGLVTGYSQPASDLLN